MAVNNEVSTENVKKAGEYFSQVLRVNWKKPEKEIKVDDSTFGQMAKEAVYAASMFLHPIRGERHPYLRSVLCPTSII